MYSIRISESWAQKSSLNNDHGEKKDNELRTDQTLKIGESLPINKDIISNS